MGCTSDDMVDMKRLMPCPINSMIEVPATCSATAHHGEADRSPSSPVMPIARELNTSASTPPESPIAKRRM